jgi:hypothetical protein
LCKQCDESVTIHGELNELTNVVTPNVEVNGIVVGETVIVVVTVQTCNVMLMTVSFLVKLPSEKEAKAANNAKMHRFLVVAAIATMSDCSASATLPEHHDEYLCFIFIYSSLSDSCHDSSLAYTNPQASPL